MLNFLRRRRDEPEPPDAVKWPWKSNVVITTRYLDGRVEVERFHNLITTAGRNLLRLGFRGDDVKIKYLGLGSGTTAPAIGQTALVTEQFRKAVTAYSTPATGSLKTTTYIAPSEANTFTIQEIGWFAGAGATSAASSGVMIARVLYTRTKTNLESIQVDRTDLFTTP